MNSAYDDAVKLLQMPDGVMQPDVLKTLKCFIQNGGEASSACNYLSGSYQGYAPMCNLVAHWLQQSGVSTEEIRHNNEKLIENVVLQRFNAKKADSIIDKAGEVPKWVYTLISTPKWRHLIYKLLTEHKDSLLLNFTIQLISDTGFQEEICHLPSASVYFNVYNRVLTYSLEKMINVSNEEEYNRELPQFITMCTHNQQTYAFSQSVLQCLMQDKRGKKLGRLSQEIFEAVMDKPIAVQLEILNKNYAEYSDDLLMSISSIIRSRNASQGDIVKLYELYNSSEPPPAYFLQRADLLDLIIREILDNCKTISDRNMTYYTYILAYASTKNSEGKFQEKEERIAHERIIELLKNFLSKCKEQMLPVEFQSFVSELYDVVDYSVLSMVIIHWIRKLLFDPNWYLSNTNGKTQEILLDLANEVTSKHPLQRVHVFNLLLSIFFLETELDPIAAADMKKRVLDSCVYLVECGFCIPVVTTVSQWANDGVDISLIRYFTVKTLNMTSPPYSTEFQSLMLHIIMSLGASSLEMEDYQNALRLFVQYSLSDESVLILEQNQQDFLEKIHRLYRLKKSM